MIFIYISDYLNLGIKGHSNFDFVDVFLNGDNRLFIDPCLIERDTQGWSKIAATHMSSYFDELYNALRSEGQHIGDLFDHAHEQNATKLGYGNGQNGKGKTAKGLEECLSKLRYLTKEIPTISCAQDLPVLVEGFAEDCMSDLLTNILHDSLNQFTALQMAKYGRKPDGEKSFFTWDCTSSSWQNASRPCWLYNGKELLLVPKWIVRKNFLFSTHQYLYGVIIERMRDEKGWHNSKKIDILNNIPKKSEHWKYDEVIDYTMSHPEALSEYHQRLPKYYGRARGCMNDEDLDKAVYRDVLKLAQ